MAVVEPFHGVRVFQGADPVIVQFPSTSVIGLMVAVDPSDLPAGVSVNTPILINRVSAAALLPDVVKEELDTIFDQVMTPVVLNLIDAGADSAELTTNAVGDATQKTGIHAFLKATSMGLPKPKLLCAPGMTTAAAPDGVASVSVTAAGSGYTEAGTTVTVEGDSTGEGAALRPIVDGGVITAIAVEKPGAGYDSPAVVTVTGDGSGATATASIGKMLSDLVMDWNEAARCTAITLTDMGTDV